MWAHRSWCRAPSIQHIGDWPNVETAVTQNCVPLLHTYIHTAPSGMIMKYYLEIFIVQNLRSPRQTPGENYEFPSLIHSFLRLVLLVTFLGSNPGPNGVLQNLKNNLKKLSNHGFYIILGYNFILVSANPTFTTWPCDNRSMIIFLSKKIRGFPNNVYATFVLMTFLSKTDSFEDQL